MQNANKIQTNEQQIQTTNKYKQVKIQTNKHDRDNNKNVSNNTSANNKNNTSASNNNNRA